MATALRYAATSHVGLVRSNNQDSGYAGPHLLVVADGMGGHAGGDVASSIAIGEMVGLDDESHGSSAMDHLADSIRQAHQELLIRVDEEPALAGMGTTVTALLRTGNRLALAHIGDSRAYLLRDGELVQLTKDHTFVQSLVDDGRITPAEAETHPHRSVVMRVLSDVIDDAEPDLSMREAKVGERYLLCSDGLSSVVSFETLAHTLGAGLDPEKTCDALVQLALRAGAPDNVTCIVADIIDEPAGGGLAPTIVGAAAAHPVHQGITPAAGDTPAERAAQLITRAIPVITDENEPDGGADAGDLAPPPRRRRQLFLLASIVALMAVIGGSAWQWVQSQVFVGNSGGNVAIFSGLPQSLGPVSLSHVQQTFPELPVAKLPDYVRNQLAVGVSAANTDAARQVVERYRKVAADCAAAAASPSPAATATTTTGGVTDAATPTAAGASPSASLTTSPTQPATVTGATPSPSGTPTSGCGGTAP